MSTPAATETPAEKPAEAPAGKAPPRRQKMRFKYKLLLIVSSLAMMGLLRTGFMFVIIAMLPSIVAYYFDVTKQRYLFRSIFASNLSGLLPFIGQLLQHGPSSNGVLQKVMGSSFTWFMVYGAAMMGWLLVKVCPLIAQMMISATTSPNSLATNACKNASKANGARKSPNSARPGRRCNTAIQAMPISPSTRRGEVRRGRDVAPLHPANGPSLTLPLQGKGLPGAHITKIGYSRYMT